MSRAVWNPLIQLAVVQVQRGKHLQVMGSWVELGGAQDNAKGLHSASTKTLVLEPEEAFLLVQWGLLAMR